MLTSQLKYYAAREIQDPVPEVVFCQEHLKLANELAQKSMVLLKNGTIKDETDQTKPLLPLCRTSFSKFAVIERLANTENTGDYGSSIVSSLRLPYRNKGSGQLCQKALR
jgi:beta-glucosidase